MSDLPTGTVTFLFTDIQGSTQLLQELGNAYEVVQNRHAEILRRAIQHCDRDLIRTEGDSFFAVFPNPVQAVRATVAAQRELAAEHWLRGQLRVRMGLHTGEGKVGGDDYVGIDVNRAARLATAAHGGQVVMSDATLGLVAHGLPEGVTTRDLGVHRMKDIAHPEHVYQLVIRGLASDFPALKSLDARPNNLPLQLTSFVGRRPQVDAVSGLLQRRRLVTLTGPGGTGKTRLALQVAETVLSRFRDGIFFVDLSPTTDPQLIASAIAQALGIKEEPGRPPVETLEDHLRDLELLLVLDNFEQIVEAARVVDELLRAAAGLRVVVTSRVTLHLYGEHEFEVPPLALPDPAQVRELDRLSQYEAVALFIDRARSVDNDFALTTQSALTIAEICMRLDGLPLAIELAAVRVKVLSLEEILARLERRLPLLTGGPRNVPERQRTLRGTIAWSHELLSEVERRLFARLSVFSGGATLEAVDTVCNPGGELEADSLDLVQSLVDKSLVRRTRTLQGEARFGMLETIREYASERLVSSDADESHRRHAEYFRALAEEAEPHFMGSDEVRWLDRFELEHDNVRAALRWVVANGRPETGLRLGAALWRFWFQRGHLHEGRAWLTELLTMTGAEDHAPAAARAYIAGGGLAYWQNDFAAARRHYEKSATVYRRLADRPGLGEALYNLAFIPMVEGDFDASEALFREALKLARESGDRGRIMEVGGGIGYLLVMKGAYSEATPHVQESIALARELGNRFYVADGLSALAQIRRFEGELKASRALFAESLELFFELANHTGIAMDLEMLSAVESAAGRHERAARLAAAASVIKDRIGGGAPEAAQMKGDAVGAARLAMGDEVVDRALEEGRAMDLDEVVAYAVADPSPSDRHS